MPLVGVDVDPARRIYRNGTARGTLILALNESCENCIVTAVTAAICPRADYDLITAIFWRISRDSNSYLSLSPINLSSSHNAIKIFPFTFRRGVEQKNVFFFALSRQKLSHCQS